MTNILRESIKDLIFEPHSHHVCGTRIQTENVVDTQFISSLFLCIQNPRECILIVLFCPFYYDYQSTTEFLPFCRTLCFLKKKKRVNEIPIERGVWESVCAMLPWEYVCIRVCVFGVSSISIVVQMRVRETVLLVHILSSIAVPLLLGRFGVD